MPPPLQRQVNRFAVTCMLLILGALYFPDLGQAQSGSCSWLSDFCVDIRAKSPGQMPSQPGCPVLGCDEMTYEVYIKNCNPSAFYAEFEYNWFALRAPF